LKNGSDDAIANYLNSIGFTQKHTMTDVRLALGYGAFAIAAACALWDYKLGFENTKLYTAVAVAVYTLLQGGLAFWIGWVEEGTVYQGTTPSGDQQVGILRDESSPDGLPLTAGGKQIFIASSSKKNTPTYTLKVTIANTKDRATGKKTFEVASSFELSRSFTEWFDETGLFVPGPFQEFLASSIPVVGKADPKRVTSASQKMLDENPDLMDAVLAASGKTEGEATGAEKKSGGKRRKA
jgi:hypothetical protein